MSFSRNNPVNGILIFIMMMILISGTVMTSLIEDVNGDEVTSGQNENTKSTYENHDPILIEGDDNFTSENGVVAGSGAENDPYLISGWSINSTGNSCIEIQNTNEFFIIEHCHLSGTGDYTRAIRINKANNMSISNNTIINIYAGISLRFVFDSLIYNNSITNIIDTGIHAFFTNIIINNNYISNTYEPIGISNCEYIIISNNQIITSTISITFSSVHEIIFENNTLFNSGIWFYSFYYYTQPAIYNNTLNGKPIYFFNNMNNFIVPTDGNQYIINECNNFIIKDIIFPNVSMSIQIINSNQGVIHSCHFASNHGLGVSIINGNEIDLLNNRFDENSIGVKIENSMNNVYKYNVFNNTRKAILSYGSFEEIFNNIFLNCTYGIDLGGENCIVYDNNFYNVDEEAVDDSGKNYWNLTDSGNYWSKYIGSDNGENGRIAGDGIGDTNIPYLGLDYFPHLNPIEFIYPVIPIFAETPQIIGTGDINISWETKWIMNYYILETDTDSDFSNPMVIHNGQNDFYNMILPEGVHYFRVRSIYSDMESIWSEVLELIVDDPPETPAGVTSSSITHEDINITWETQPDLFPIVYIIEMSTSIDGPFEIIPDLDQNRSWHIVTDLSENTAYFFRVKVVDVHGLESLYSVVNNFTTEFDQYPPKVNTTIFIIEVMEDVPLLCSTPSLPLLLAAESTSLIFQWIS